MNEGTKKDFSDLYDYYYSSWDQWLAAAQDDMEMVLGAQFSAAEHSWAENEGRTLLPFNKMKRQVDLLHGYEIRNRHILKIGPIGREDDAPCRQHTGLIMNLMAAKEGYNYLSEAFRWGSLVSGSNLLEIWRDRKGQLRFNRRGHNTFLLDPMLTRKDLSDCGSIITGDWIHEDKIKTLLPSMKKDLKKIPPLAASRRWPRIPAKHLGKDDGLRLYEQWWKRETSYKTMVIDRMTGQSISFSDFVNKVMGGDTKKANYFVDNFRLPNGMPGLSKYEEPITNVKLKILIDEEPVHEGNNPLGLDDYNFVWLAGDWIPEMDRVELKLQSFARSIRFPQIARNKRLNQMIDIIEVSLTQWKRAKEGALVNNEDAYGSGQGKVVWIKKDFQGGLSDAIEQMGGVDIPAGMFNVLEVLDKEDVEEGGLNQEIFGSDDKDIPGILHRYRTGQALTGKQGVFSGFRQAKRQLGRKLVRLQQKYEPDKVFRVLNQWPVQGFYQEDFDKFDCTPTEGLMTDSQIHLAYLELLHIKQAFPEEAKIIPISKLIEAAPIQYKDELMKAIQQAEQQQQQMMQIQLQDKRNMDALMAAQVQEDISQAQENRADTAYTRARTMAEIIKMKTDSYLEFLDRMIKLEELKTQPKTKSIKSKVKK